MANPRAETASLAAVAVRTIAVLLSLIVLVASVLAATSVSASPYVYDGDRGGDWLFTRVASNDDAEQRVPDDVGLAADATGGYDHRSQLARTNARLVGYRSAPRATLSGRTVLGESWDDAIRAGRGARPEAGFHDVVAHGTPTGIYDAAGNLLSPAEAAAVIRGTPSWGGQNIRLLSCSTGCPTGNFAQGLANELGVGVRAPTVDFFVNSRGIPVLDPGGRWITYMPGGG